MGCGTVAIDNRPPGTNPAKARYMFEDLKRLNKYYAIPLNKPAVCNLSCVM